jgi:hypothetical protein
MSSEVSKSSLEAQLSDIVTAPPPKPSLSEVSVTSKLKRKSDSLQPIVIQHDTDAIVMLPTRNVKQKIDEADGDKVIPKISVFQPQVLKAVTRSSSLLSRPVLNISSVQEVRIEAAKSSTTTTTTTSSGIKTTTTTTMSSAPVVKTTTTTTMSSAPVVKTTTTSKTTVIPSRSVQSAFEKTTILASKHKPTLISSAVTVPVFAPSNSLSLSSSSISASSSSSSSSTAAASIATAIVSSPAVVWHIPASARMYVTPSKPSISGAADGSPFLDSYTDTVYSHNRKMEKVRSPTFGYLEQKQPNVSTQLRAQTIETMSRLHGRWKLQTETMFLSVNLLDRYLGLAASLQQNQMQLLGVTCLWVASKHEETWKSEVSVEQCVFALEPQLEIASRRVASGGCSSYNSAHPHIPDYKGLTDQWRKSIKKAEEHVLGQLHFRICAPTSHTFIVRFLSSAKIDDTTSVGYLAMLLAELCLLSYSMLRYRPSEVAATCLFLSMRLYLGEASWAGSNMALHTGFTNEAVLKVAKECSEIAILSALGSVAHTVLGRDGQIAAVAEIGGAGVRYGNAYFVFEKYKLASRKAVANDLISVNAYVMLRRL